MADQIIVRGARLHNLKNVDLAIPRNRLVVLTGVSGSGKSTLAFDILHREAQRQYMESLGMAPFGLSRPPVDAIVGLSPSISVDQRLANRSPRSTVGTTTDIYTYLRVLFARLGHRPCPACGQDIPPSFDPGDAPWEGEAGGAGDLSEPVETLPCPHCESPVPRLIMAHFSFNKPEGACPTCSGLGTVQQADLERLVDRTKSISEGAVAGWNAVQMDYYSTVLRAAATYFGLDWDPSIPIQDYRPPQRDLLFFGVASPRFRRHFPNIEPPATVRRGRFEGVATSTLRRYAEHLGQHASEAGYRDKLEESIVTERCPDCAGTRLRPESRAVTVDGQDIVALSRLPIDRLGAWLDALPARLDADEMLVAKPVLMELRERIDRVIEVGGGYLTLERASPSLSAGEAQRLRLASLLGSQLSGLLYVFDEPTIGLHHRDTRRLIEVLRRLRDLGNTVLVVEHDLEMIAAADQVVDFGPGAGNRGGQVIAAGSPAEIVRQPGSITGDYLAGRASIPLPRQRRAPDGRAIILHGVRHHNLQNVTVSLPLGLLVAVTGVSGSGKSSLLFEVLERDLRRHLKGAPGGQRLAGFETSPDSPAARGYGAGDEPGDHDSIEGCHHIERVVTIDQAQIGRIPRSNVATYSDSFTPIREAFAATPEARARALSARHFSFNLPGGRCERCQGAGVLTVSMQLLPDVEVRCPACHGRRFTRETLAVHYRGHDISQLLDMTVQEALPLFESVPPAFSRLRMLSEVGLGYLQLGQTATTLSGGEAQRVKLARELGRRVTGHTLYLLDEPTTGLHLADTARLLGVLQRLVDAGNSVMVVEHNLEIVKAADWVIDLGPEGGAEGGRVIGQGTPEQIAETPGSYTGMGLREIL